MPMQPPGPHAAPPQPPPEVCDYHPDRPAVARYGHDDMDGGQRPVFRVTKRLCFACDADWRRNNLFIDRT